MIKLESGEVKEVFLNQEQYQKIKHYSLSDLNEKDKKIVIELEVQET